MHFIKRKIYTIPLIFLLVILIGLLAVYFSPVRQLLIFLPQVTKERVGTFIDLQPEAQKGAFFVGSENCAECHKKIYEKQSVSMHTKMIQDVSSDPSVIVGDFMTLPEDADFELKNVVYTIGSKFKQRYMLRKDYPEGFEPGMSLAAFKKTMPYEPGVSDAKFYGNGAKPIGKRVNQLKD